MFKFVNKIYFKLLRNEQRKELFKMGFKKEHIRVFEEISFKYYGYFIKLFMKDIRNGNRIEVDGDYLYDIDVNKSEKTKDKNKLYPKYHIETNIIKDENNKKNFDTVTKNQFNLPDIYNKYYVYCVNYDIPIRSTDLSIHVLCELMKDKSKNDIVEIKRYMNLVIMVKFFGKIHNLSTMLFPYVYISNINFSNNKLFAHYTMNLKFYHVVCEL